MSPFSGRRSVISNQGRTFSPIPAESWPDRAPVVAVWETTAQHFATIDGSGAFEQRPGFNRSSGKSLMEYYYTSSFKYATDLCVTTTPGVRDWRNVLLEEQVLQMPEKGDLAAARAVWLPGFHASSQAWGPLLHVQRGDCSHTWCYTPYFFAQLWMSVATALAPPPHTKTFPREGLIRRYMKTSHPPLNHMRAQRRQGK